MNRDFGALAAATLLLAVSSNAGDSFHLVVGYTRSAVQDVYVEDGKKVVKAMVGRYLAVADPDIQAELATFEDGSAMSQALTLKRVDLVGGASNQIVEMLRRLALEPALVTELSGGVYDDAVLLIRKDSGFVRLADLRGKRLMILEGAAMGHQHLWLDTWTLRETHERVTSLFASVKEGRTSSQVILACFFSTTDVCLVPRSAFDLARELNPQLGERLAVLGSSHGLVGAIVAFRPDYEARHKARVIQLMTHLQDDPRGQQLLNLFRRNRLVAFRSEYLTGIEALVSEHAERLKAHRASGKRP